jgi:hypothetical protein
MASETELARWSTTLDAGNKGFISDRDLYRSLYACGLEPTEEEVAGVTCLAANTDRARASLDLFNSLGYSQEAAADLILYYRKEGFQFRPDAFRYLTYRKYFTSRLLAYLVPGLAAWTQQYQMPCYTSHEVAPYYAVMCAVVPLCSIASLAIYISLALWGLGYTETIKLSEILSNFFINIVTIMGTQAGREGMICSKEGSRCNQAIYENVTSLKFIAVTLTNGSVIKGSDALVLFTRSCTSSGQKQIAHHFLANLMQESAMAHHNAATTPAKSGGQSSSLGDALAGNLENLQQDRDSGEDLSGLYSDKYNIFSVNNIAKLAPWVVALGMALVPTIVGKLRGEVTMIDADAAGADLAVDVMFFFLALIQIAALSQVILNSALSEMGTCAAFSKFLLGSVCEGTGWRHRQNEVLDFHIRLDSIAAVENFEALYFCVRSICFAYGEYHKSPFEILMLLCVASVLTVVVGSAYELEVDTWNATLFIEGSAVLVIASAVFLRMVTMHERMGVEMRQRLWYQRRLNDEAVIREEMSVVKDNENNQSNERVRRLEQASNKIERLREEIKHIHGPHRLLGFIPLTRDNVVKGSAAIAFGLFGTVLRTSLNV